MHIHETHQHINTHTYTYTFSANNHYKKIRKTKRIREEKYLDGDKRDIRTLKNRLKGFFNILFFLNRVLYFFFLLKGRGRKRGRERIAYSCCHRRNTTHGKEKLRLLPQRERERERKCILMLIR